MILSIVFLLLIAGIVFYQTAQGLFSALIMAVLSILCAALALGTFEPLALSAPGWLTLSVAIGLLASWAIMTFRPDWIGGVVGAIGGVVVGVGAGLGMGSAGVLNEPLVLRMGPYAEPAVLVAMFALPLLAARVFFDHVVSGNVVADRWIDRAGGVLFGLVTAFTLVGILALVVQLLPFPATILGWEPYDASLTEKDGGPARWASDWTLGWGNLLLGKESPRALAPDGVEPFGKTHDDLVLQAWAMRNRPEGAAVAARPDAITVLGVYNLAEQSKDRDIDWEAREAWRKQVLDAVPPSMQAPSDSVVYLVRVQVDQSARDPSDNWFRLPATHFRLVGDKSEQSYFPVAYLTYVGGWRVNTEHAERSKYADVGRIIVGRPWGDATGPAKLTVDWLYRLPKGELPRQLVFRRAAYGARTFAVVPGLPPARNKDGTLLTLGVQGKPYSVDLEKGADLFVGDKLETAETENLPAIFYIRSGSPIPGLKESDAKSGRFRKVLYDGSLELPRLVGGPDVIAVRFFQAPDARALVRATLTVPSTANLPRDLSTWTARLRLASGQDVPAVGVWARGADSLYIQYDADQPLGPLSAKFAQMLSEKKPLFALLFLVPRDQMAVSVEFVESSGKIHSIPAVSPLTMAQ